MVDTVFQELTDRLKKVKTEKDINNDLADELINAGIVCAMQVVKRSDKKLKDIEALELTRMVVLKHFDSILLDLYDSEEFDEMQ